MFRTNRVFVKYNFFVALNFCLSLDHYFGFVKMSMEKMFTENIKPVQKISVMNLCPASKPVINWPQKYNSFPPR